jgi:bifunctional non-homologous end joining protein LigD
MKWRIPSPWRRPPGFIEPCNPTRANKPPVGPDWIHEIKHDGYRMIVRKKDDRVRLFTRRGYDWTDRYLIRDGVAALRPTALVLDGEAVYCGPDGVANFEMLHSQTHNDRVFLYVFDLLELRGVDLRVEPLEERRGRLQYLMQKVVHPGVQFNEHIDGDGATVFEHACKLGFEGIVSKHRKHPYRSGPTKSWIKVKNPAAPGVLRFKDKP